jgi:hypothetical protein
VTPVILLVLVVLWIVVLAPSVWRKRTERRSSGSIDTFHRQLHLLERTGPKIVAPAYRLQSVGAPTPTVPGQSGYPVVSSAAHRPNLVLLRNDGTRDELATEGTGPAPAGLSVVEAPAVPPLEQGHDRYRRRQATRRRRDILCGLLATFVLTALLGLIHSLRLLWILTVLSGLGIVAYVALVSYARSLSAGRRQGAPRRVAAPQPYRFEPARAGYPGAWDTDEEVALYAPMRAVGSR